MGSQVGSFEEENPESLIGQGSLYSLTLDEVQNQLGNLGKPLESMNLDELLKSVDTGGSWSSPLRRQGSLTLSRGLSKKTVEEVWRNIQQENKKDAENQERNAPLGEMTLEDFLVKAGVVTESAPLQQQESAQWMQFQNPTVPEPPYQNNIMTGFMQGHPVQQSLPVADAAYPNSQMNLSPSSLMGTLSDTQTPGRKRVASGDVAEKTVERKQKRMIKNRESAARSRARRQAYTNELEIKVYHLEEENERLRRQKEVEKVLPCAPPPEPKSQLRRTSSAIPSPRSLAIRTSFVLDSLLVYSGTFSAVNRVGTAFDGVTGGGEGYVLISFAREVSVFFVVAAKVVGKHAEIDVGIYAWLSVIYGTFVEEDLC
ncbi:hypothetical protein NC652_035998 [Populus alba x Populus x berolinensis]|uniref:Uncharacterized protein n=1 Tax=Populus alba TaxID=43335 RepID=A0ACC4ARL2_POPAL|nr:hypothetical protein NC652_035998 [Populus alba x Populus x berolinensis]